MKELIEQELKESIVAMTQAQERAMFLAGWVEALKMVLSKFNDEPKKDDSVDNV